MKSLYQYICEGIRKWASLNEWIHVIGDAIKPYTFDELNTSYRPRDYYFLLKSKKPNELWLADGNKNEAIKILRKLGKFEVIKDQGNNFEASLTVKGVNLPIHVYNTGKGMKEPGVDTEEQENMMCHVFNDYFRHGRTEEQATVNIAGSDKLRVSWVKSSWIHCLDIEEIINETKGKINEYYMVRVDNKINPVVSAYLEFREAYRIARGFGRITSVDPTDVIMYHEKSMNVIIQEFNTLIKMIDDDDAQGAVLQYRKFVKDNTYILPISLKKAITRGDMATGSSKHLVFYNTEDGKIEKPEVHSVELIGITPMNVQADPEDIEIDGDTVIFNRKKIKLKNISSVYSFVKCSKLGTNDDTAKICYRTFGKSLAIDITLNPKHNSTAFGKVSTHTWRRIFDHNEKGQMSILTDEQKSKFIQFFKDFRTNKSDINDMLADGMKVGNQRFPYALLK